MEGGESNEGSDKLYDVTHVEPTFILILLGGNNKPWNELGFFDLTPSLMISIPCSDALAYFGGCENEQQPISKLSRLFFPRNLACSVRVDGSIAS